MVSLNSPYITKVKLLFPYIPLTGLGTDFRVQLKTPIHVETAVDLRASGLPLPAVELQLPEDVGEKSPLGLQIQKMSRQPSYPAQGTTTKGALASAR